MSPDWRSSRMPGTRRKRSGRQGVRSVREGRSPRFAIFEQANAAASHSSIRDPVLVSAPIAHAPPHGCAQLRILSSRFTVGSAPTCRNCSAERGHRACSPPDRGCHRAFACGAHERRLDSQIRGPEERHQDHRHQPANENAAAANGAIVIAGNRITSTISTRFSRTIVVYRMFWRYLLVLSALSYKRLWCAPRASIPSSSESFRTKAGGAAWRDGHRDHRRDRNRSHRDDRGGGPLQAASTCPRARTRCAPRLDGFAPSSGGRRRFMSARPSASISCSRSRASPNR